MAEVQAGDVTSATTPVAAPEATTAPESTAGQVAQVETPEAPKQEKLLTQEEVNKIVAREKARESRRAERIATERAERLYWQRMYEQQNQPQQQQRRGEPQPTDFKTYEQYVDALVEHRLEQRLNAREQQSQMTQQQRQAQEHAAKLRERLSEGADEFEDFEEVALADHVPISSAMAAAISESDVPAKLAYYLGSHLDEARKIAGLPPTKQVRELSKIEEMLTAAPKPKPAPEPIKPNAGTASTEKPIDQQSYDEFVKTRHRQLAAKGKRRYLTS